jgi:hypothetical protein
MILTLAALLAVAPAALAQTLSPAAAPAAAPAPANDYADPANWLCLPNRADDACGRSNQDATVIDADGAMRVERFHRDPDAKIDCFYVYPTVSLDPGGNATMKVEKEERAVVNQQFARFGAVCRTFAPLYRQATLTALRSNIEGHPMPVDRELPYKDVKAAWDWYLAHENHGRPVALIGHSQGSLVLAALVARDIDGKPVQKKILSVTLAGYFLQVPVGQDVGGDFKSIPLCKTARQTGCAINFASFRADSPPTKQSFFGASRGATTEAACVDPAALLGRAPALHAYLAAGAEGATGDGLAAGAWTNPAKPVTTPFVEVPGMLTADCAHAGDHHVLSVTIHPSPGGKRTGVLTGDVVIRGKVLPEWGLHRIDMNLVMGDLVEVVRQEGRAYLAEASSDKAQ